MSKQLTTRSKVATKPTKCDACGRCISEGEWYLLLKYDGKIHPVHDDDNCPEAMKIQMGLPGNHFKAAISIMEQDHRRSYYTER